MSQNHAPTDFQALYIRVLEDELGESQIELEDAHAALIAIAGLSESQWPLSMEGAQGMARAALWRAGKPSGAPLTSPLDTALTAWRALSEPQREHIALYIDILEPVTPKVAEAIGAGLTLLRAAAVKP